jgi:3-deoxy-7-phosphoheptulonate synthase
MNNSYKLSSRDFQKDSSTIQVGNILIGGEKIVCIAGPCTVENRNDLVDTAQAVKMAGATILRGGAFKIRTSPYTFQGLGFDGLKMLAEAGSRLGMPIVSEVIDTRDVEIMIQYADMLQIGSRNMQNTALLKEVGLCSKPILLKRGFGCTIEEWLLAADYIISGGNHRVVLCERGIRAFENSTRFSLDILSIPVVKKLSHLPIIVDPSHAAGDRSLVASVARAAIAAGADGLLVEVNSNAHKALVDGPQSMTTEQFSRLMLQIGKIAQIVERSY